MDYSNSNEDREATEDYYSSEDDGEAYKKNKDYYSDGGEDEGGVKFSDPEEDIEKAEKGPTTKVFH